MAFKKIMQKEKLQHYSEVAKGLKAVKSESKFSEAEQRAYARGQRDARNENNRLFKWKNSTPEEREAYKIKRAEERKAYKAKNKSKV